MLRFALIGAGRIGALHAANIVAAPGAALAVVFDADAGAARRVAELSGAKIAGSAADAVADAGVDAVLIASPTETHVELTLAAAAAGKAVLCEKPVSLEVDEAARAAAELAAMAKTRGAQNPPVQVGFNRRFDPGHAELARRVGGGDIGRLEQLVITSRDPALPSMEYLRASGGIFRDMMIHDFDLARFVVGAGNGEEIATVSAAATVQIDSRLRDIGDHDSAMVTLSTDSGALCCIVNSRRAAFGYDQRAEAFGARGMLISGNRAQTAVAFYNHEVTSARPPLLHFFTERYADAYKLQLAAFVESVKAGRAPAPSFEDGRRALVLAAAAEQSLRDGRAVTVKFQST